MEEKAKILAAAGAVFARDGKRPLTDSDLDSFSSVLHSKGIVHNKLMLYSAHLTGSCRMSADHSAGPTSPSGELQSVRKLFVGDACVFTPLRR